ncbi:Serine/threonine-protein phosphatase 4 catalytic subunit 1 [Cucumispora dikerogammari]|nr:Serine/threonine-protein phosphatase 4 catalytic subunit 1 [Cucumispora dikerogammari]
MSKNIENDTYACGIKKLSTQDKYYIDLLRKIRNSVLPEPNAIIKLINHSKKLFLKEDNIVYLHYRDTSSPVKIYGDVHGQYYDLLSTFAESKINSYNIFLGDYVDRGLNSIETMVFILLLKALCPRKTFILRGNHEFEDITYFYGFQTECLEKYDTYIYEKFIDLFRYMPVCCIIESKKHLGIGTPNYRVVTKRFFCVHGGITNKENLIKEITKVDRTRPSKFVMDLFWSDPTEIDNGFINNPRGAGVMYGEESLLNFLKQNGFDYIIRSHQLVMDGFKKYFQDKLLLVWSAPNYCYRQGNAACYIKIDTNSSHDYEVVFFDKVEVQYRKNLPLNHTTVDYYTLKE